MVVTPRRPAAAAADKQRGGYYTPAAVADFLAGFALAGGARRILEPSCGDGELLAAVARAAPPGARIDAVELAPAEAARAAARAGARADVAVGDAFAWYEAARPDGAFDAVVGNPPFIRYQSFAESQRERAFRLMREEGLAPTRLTNAWVPFVVMATRALRPGGRLALVVPAELLQVGYAAQLRGYLARSYARLRVVAFRRLLFAGVQQEVVLLLGVRAAPGAAGCRIAVEELDSAAALAAADGGTRPELALDLDHAREKWTRYLLTPAELGLVRALEDWSGRTSLGALAEVDVGVVTGRNEVFVLDEPSARAAGVRAHCMPLVGRSAQISGLVLEPGDWARHAAGGGRCLLLQLGRRERAELDPAARRYVERAEAAGLHAGYKCRIREPRWWNVPSVWTPDAFLLRQIHDAPRIVRNRTAATCTDTIHRVRVRPGVDADALAAASVGSLVAAFAELHGRSYGGGVLELEPREAEALPFPALHRTPPLDDIREALGRHGLDAAAALVDRATLREAGIEARDVDRLRTVWRRLAERRRTRRH